ncbi:tRNA (uracil-5-)-methyltransferase-like [Gracilariopsis chorda]|uniref:tRNA (Uracil-5-)-methyltransferase-like n=1 Tax=Gracilariopsis chorda TaxID=448386 RepID=A0A2V3IQB2_9FLOR|nr:tRNA (uracil-5-)-methyltransferase-like [Gracilariopsis chorda]|eukprot:PXF43330.1 tRNA (uracil-5-)-methyltransferase-like [Gracilariopsis chorda]
MGSFFSKEPVNRPTQYGASYGSPEKPTRKRKFEFQGATPSTIESKTAFSHPRTDEKTTEVDAAPDGNVHRYIVTCSTIFWCTRKDIVKLLSKVDDMPPYGGLHKITKWDHFFIAFPNEKCAKLGVDCLSKNEYRGELWKVRETTEHSAKRMRIDDTVARSRENTDTMAKGVCLSAADVTAKWRNVGYEEQITRKKRKWANALQLVTKNLHREIRKEGRIQWLDDLRRSCDKKGSPECCPLVDVLRAEKQGERNFYRNKNEFTIGFSPDGCGMGHKYHVSELTIGYALGLVRNGQVFVSPVDENCSTTSKASIEVAKCLTPVLRSLNMPPYDKRTHKGYWRQITCREGVRTGELIVSVVVNPFDKDDTEIEKRTTREADGECRTAVVEALKTYFGTNKKLGVFWQTSNHISAVSSDIPALHLYGIEGLHEEICGLRYRIQPTAFFQVNTLMAERMYGLLGDLAGVNKNTVVFDVCCGTGTIGLSLAGRAHSVVGIEMNESAVEDAVNNARLNGIQNATFIRGKVEHRIHDAIKEVPGDKDCVAILDPPRAGLPMNVVAAVRGMRSVKRIVYVACEPNNFWKNALGFLRPRSKAFRLEPFRPVKAYGIDLFPHTDHGELAVLLERNGVQIA